MVKGIPKTRKYKGINLQLKTCHTKPNLAKKKQESFKREGWAHARVYKVGEKHCVYARKFVAGKKPKGVKCMKSSLKKYTTRPGPPYPANDCCGSTRKGNDGKMWFSKMDSAGICRWRRKK